MEHKVINIQGRSHIHAHTPCEDAFSVSDDATVFCLADGVSNSSMGGEGAKYRAAEMQKWLAHAHVKSAFVALSSDSIRAHVYNQLQAIDEMLCASVPGSRPEDFASTLLCAVELNETTMCLIHCGDGVIFGFPNTAQKTPVILSGPDNAAGGAVYYAGHPEQRTRMRVFRICKTDYSTILLGTDGFTDPYFRYPFNADFDLLENLMSTNSAESFDALFEEHHKDITDDISCILIETGCEAGASAPIPQAVVRDAPSQETASKPVKRLPKQPQNGAVYRSGEIPVRVEKRENNSNANQQPKRQKKPTVRPDTRPRSSLPKRFLVTVISLTVLGSLTYFVVSTLVSLNKLKSENAAMADQISVLESRVEQITASRRYVALPQDVE